MSRNRAGTALMITLWVMVILSSVALTFSYHTRLDLRMSTYQVQRMQARFLAHAGVTRALALLRDDLLKDHDLLEDEGLVELDNEDKGFVYDAYAESWGSEEDLIKDVEYGGGTFTVRIIDLNSRLNLNAGWVTADILARLLETLGLEEDPAKRLAALMVDWRDPDNNTSDAGQDNLNESGTEDEFWNPDQHPSDVQEVGPQFVLKNAPFDTMEEVLLLLEHLEMDPAILYGEDANGNGKLDPNEQDGELSPPWDDGNDTLQLGLMDFCTVEGSGAINLNTAERRVLEAMLFPIVGEDAENMAEDLDEYRKGSDDEFGTRDDKFFREINNQDQDDMDLMNVTSLDVQTMSQLKRMGGVASGQFMIIATGHVREVEYTVRAQVTRNFIPEEQLGRDPLNSSAVVDLSDLTARELEQVRFVFERYEDS